MCYVVPFVRTRTTLPVTALSIVMSTVRMLPAWTLVHTFCVVPSPVFLLIDPSRKLSTTGHRQYLAGLLVTSHNAKF